MLSAILFIKDQKEADLASIVIYDKMLIEYTIHNLKRLDVDMIYLLGDYENKLKLKDVVKRNNIGEIITEIGLKEGKCLLVSPFYPLVTKDDYKQLIVNENSVFYDDDIVPIFCLNNKKLIDFENINYHPVSLSKENQKAFRGIKDVSSFWKTIKRRIINNHLENGILIEDSDTVSIGENVNIDKGTYIGTNVEIKGLTTIGKYNKILKGCDLINAKLGDYNTINDSKIYNSQLLDHCHVGPCSIINENSYIDNYCMIGSYTRLDDCKVSCHCQIEHLSYLSKATIKDHVLIGSNVTTVNNKHLFIDSNSEVGNNVNLISPLFIGSYAIVATGSTIDKNVDDGDLAIARLYQQNKKGYGYKYTREENK